MRQWVMVLCCCILPFAFLCGCTQLNTKEQLQIYQDALGAKVQAAKDLHVRAAVAGTVSLNGKVGGLSQNIEGPVQGTIMTFFEIDPDRVTAPTMPAVSTATTAETLALLEALSVRVEDRLLHAEFADAQEFSRLVAVKDYLDQALPLYRQLAQIKLIPFLGGDMHGAMVAAPCD